MCLTGVDYFSTLGYQPGIAVLAAGLLAPAATVVLVALTLFGALPVYRRVAAESPHGAGSIAMLERLLPFWRGKLGVLVLLGFAVTDFVITITLSASDATAHLVDNPLVPASLADHRVAITLGLLAVLGAVFLRGFGEAVGLAVGLVGVYLALNLVVVAVGLWHLATTAGVVGSWAAALTAQHGSPLAVIGVALLVFPRLALGLSGFETGVAVMPLVRGDPADTEPRPSGRIRGTRRLLTTAAVVMSGYLLATSVVTTLLIPQAAFQPGGQADGRALAYLAHQYLGPVFGTAYDLSTIAILWFAGASAMAGLLNLIPRYLPRYGMAPAWAGAVRPLVLVLTAVAGAVTWAFRADVDAQGGAYATGVLVLITSAAVAVTLSARRARQRWRYAAFAGIAAVFAYTTVVNVLRRPDGLRIGVLFIGALLLVSLVSRIARSWELRVTDVALDPMAEMFLRDGSRRTLRLVACRPVERCEDAYRAKLARLRRDHGLDEGDVVFAEVHVADPSDFAGRVEVRGQIRHGRHRVLVLSGTSVAQSMAALLLEAARRTGAVPSVYFEWSEGNPLAKLLGFLAFGAGQVATVTREVLREAEPDPGRRPRVHVS